MSITLEVSRAELSAALKTLGRHSSVKGRVEAVLSFEQGHLTVRAPGLELNVPAAGEWPGAARVGLQALAGLGRVDLPEDDPLFLTVTENRIRLGPLSLPCIWSAAASPTIELPLDPPLLAILRITRKHTSEEIERAGLADLVVRAHKKKDELAAKACESLEPLGIRPAVILRLVEESLDRHDAPLTSTEGAVRL